MVAQSPKLTPSARAVSTASPSTGTVLMFSSAWLKGTGRMSGGSSATIFPKSPRSTHRTAAAPDTKAVTELELAKLAGRPRRAFVKTKRFLLGRVWEEMRQGSPDEDAAFLECWFEDETKERIAGVASSLRQ